MARNFDRPITGDIAARYKGLIYGTGVRHTNLVPLNYYWSVHHSLTEGFKYIWVYRQHTDGSYRPFSWLKVKQVPGKRGPSKTTVMKMIDELTQRVLEFEADDEIHVITLGEARSKKPKRKRFK